MAVITLAGNTIGCCIGTGSFEGVGTAFSSAKQSVKSLTQGISTLKSKIDTARVAANVDTSHTQAQNAEKREETKQSALTTGYDKLENLISDVSTVDNKSADKIRERKNDFYAQYSYLKPECEKSMREKAKEKWDKFKSWCQDHVVGIFTAVAVILVAAVAAVFLGPAFVAAICAAIALACTAGDLIAMAVTGKDMYTFLKDGDHPILAEIFGGLQWGCDIASILIPAASFIKQGASFISKFGMKQFLKSSKQSFVLSIKSTWNQLFHSGWKQGFKNSFKIFVFNFDDLKRSNAPMKMVNSQQWISDGKKLVPKSGGSNYKDCIKALKEIGLDGLPIDKRGNSDPYALNKYILKDCYPNGITVDIDTFSDIRGGKYVLNPKNGTTNFSQANNELMSNYNIKLKELEDKLGFKLTWHEDLNLKTLIPLPTKLHGPSNVQYVHTGGVQVYQYMFPRTSNIIENSLKITVPNVIEEIISRFKEAVPN